MRGNSGDSRGLTAAGSGGNAVPGGAGRVHWGVLAVLLGGACLLMGVLMFQQYRESSLRLKRAQNPRREKIGRVTLWFDEFADDALAALRRAIEG